MTTDLPDSQSFNYARLAGFLYLGVAVCGGFAEFFVRQALVVPGDAAATAANIVASEALFRAAFVADLLVVLLDLLLAIALFFLFRPAAPRLAFVVLVLHLARIPVIAANPANHFGALLLLDGSALPGWEVVEREAMALFLLDLHAHAYAAAGILFGAWCFAVGWLVWIKGLVPTAIAAMLMVALVGYWSDLVVTFLTPGIEPIVSPFAVIPAALAEIALCLWLLVKGGDVHRRASRVDISVSHVLP